MKYFLTDFLRSFTEKRQNLALGWKAEYLLSIQAFQGFPSNFLIC